MSERAFNKIKAGLESALVDSKARKAGYAAGFRAGQEAMRRQAMNIARPATARPCDCDRCYCGNVGDAEMVSQWDEASALATGIAALPLEEMEK